MAAILLSQAHLAAVPSLAFRPSPPRLSLPSPFVTPKRCPFPPHALALALAQPRQCSPPPPRAAPPSRGGVNETKGDDLDQRIQEGILTAMEVCAGNETSEECIVEWDAVEEMSAAKADKRNRQKLVKDPLEEYCKDNPETDECRVYED